MLQISEHANNITQRLRNGAELLFWILMHKITATIYFLTNARQFKITIVLYMYNFVLNHFYFFTMLLCCRPSKRIYASWAQTCSTVS